MWLLIEADADRTCVEIVFAPGRPWRYTAPQCQYGVRNSSIGAFSGRLWAGRRKRLVNQCNEKYALPMSPCPHVPSPSTGGQGRPWPRCRAVDVVDYCAHKQVRYRRQINLNRPSTVSERCKAGHTCHASAQKTVKVQIDTPPASATRTASLPVHGSVDSLGGRKGFVCCRLAVSGWNSH